MTNIYWALNSIPSILCVLMKEVLVGGPSFQTWGNWGTERLAHCHMGHKIAKPELSSHLYHGPTAQSRPAQENHHYLREVCPRTHFADSASQASAPPVEPPGLREGSPLWQLPDHMLWGFSCLHFCLPSRGGVAEQESIPGTGAVAGKRSPDRSSAATCHFSLWKWTKAPVPNISQGQAAGGCALWFLCSLGFIVESSSFC